MTPALQQACAKAMQMITPDGTQLAAGRAVVFALEQVGASPTVMRVAARRPFIWVVEALYQIVARNRTLVSRLLFIGRTKDGPTC